MRKTWTKSLCLLFALLVFAATVFTQNRNDADPKDSFYRAVSLTKQALDKLDGNEIKDGTRGIHWVGTGRYDISARMQGLNYSKPDIAPITEEFGFDPKSNAILYEYNTKVNHDADEWIRFVYDGRGRMLVINPAAKWAIWTSGADTENQRKGYARMIPQILLTEALEERSTLRYEGTALVQNEPVEVVSFRPRNSPVLSLLISKGSGFFRGVEYLIDHPLLGDTAVRWLFDDYRKVDGFGMFPFKYDIYLDSRVLKSVQIREARSGFDAASQMSSTGDIKIPNPPDISADASSGPDAQKKRESPIEQIGENVFLVRNIRGGFHVLVVKFKDHLMVVDTPAGYHELQQIPAIDWAGEKSSSAVGERLLELLRTKFPNLPVKYVVLTHHHSDHAGGIFPFLKNGTTVIASKETLAVLNHALKNRFTLDSLDAKNERKFSQVEVSENKTITDGNLEVEIRNVGENPHADGMLVVYIRGDDILYQSDLFEPFEDEENPSPSRLTVMKWFVRWLKSSKLAPKKIFAIHGSALVTDKQVEKVRQIDDADLR